MALDSASTPLPAISPARNTPATSRESPCALMRPPLSPTSAPLSTVLGIILRRCLGGFFFICRKRSKLWKQSFSTIYGPSINLFNLIQLLLNYRNKHKKNERTHAVSNYARFWSGLAQLSHKIFHFRGTGSDFAYNPCGIKRQLMHVVSCDS